MQKHVNLVDLVKSFPTNIYLQKLTSIQKRTSPIKFAHLAGKLEKGSISNLSTKNATGEASGATALSAPAGVGQSLSTASGIKRIKAGRSFSPRSSEFPPQFQANFVAFFDPSCIFPGCTTGLRRLPLALTPER